jgi:hypothetical protein
MGIEKENRLSEVDVFVASALVIESFEEASNALLSLRKNHKSRAAEVALKILDQRIGDIFYHALAFEVLYSVSLNDALAYIETKAGDESAYVLGAMLEAVTEDAGAIEYRDEIFKVVSLLRKALMLRSPEDLSAIAIKMTRFEEAYR